MPASAADGSYTVNVSATGPAHKENGDALTFTQHDSFAVTIDCVADGNVPPTPYHVQFWKSSAGASCTGTPLLNVTPSDDGFYFGALAEGTQFFVQVCKGPTQVASSSLKHKLGKDELEEEGLLEPAAVALTEERLMRRSPRAQRQEVDNRTRPRTSRVARVARLRSARARRHRRRGVQGRAALPCRR